MEDEAAAKAFLYPLSPILNSDPISVDLLVSAMTFEEVKGSLESAPKLSDKEIKAIMAETERAAGDIKKPPRVSASKPNASLRSGNLTMACVLSAATMTASR